MKGAPISFIICVVVLTGLLGIGIYWLVDHLYSAEIQGKEATIQAKEATIQVLQTRVAILNGTTPATPNAEIQVKSEALILSQQIIDFAKAYKPGAEPYFRGDYDHRFQLRVDNMRNSLDQLGQDSTNLDIMLGYRTVQGVPWVTSDEMFSNFVINVAEEIQGLANNLKSP